MNNLLKKVKTELGFKSQMLMTSEQQVEASRLLRFVMVSAGVTLLAVEPTILYAGGGAAAAASAGSLETMVTNILATLTGTFGKAIATIAIMVMGIMAMFGKLAWETAVKVIVGIAITFGAASIVTWVTGGTAFDSI